ncbi:hypothetical protein GCM10020221_20540 [Streptomyces thioluteus]|uniref:Uncharacterized protein n=1 Tax=Streptomyces thioluteus TaxID=66431 RepID=A0ABN3WSZ3_STRTU
MIEGSARITLRTSASLPAPLVEDPGLHVQRLRGDPQGLGQLLEDLGARLAQAALDLAEIRVGHSRRVGELTQRQLRVAPLLAQILAEIADVERCHVADAAAPC